MNLKAIIEQDLQNVFFNTNEFAEVHFLDDKEIPIIIDEDECKYIDTELDIYEEE